MIGIMHLIYGGFFSMVTGMLLLFTVLMGASMWSMPEDPNAPPAAFFIALMSIVTFIYGLLSLPSLLAGYGMLKRRSWGRVAGIVASCISSLSFPFGMALCIYTLWFLLGDAGKEFERQRASGDRQGATYGAHGSLGQAPTSSYGWSAQGSGRERAYEPPREYKPPTEPPNWRE